MFNSQINFFSFSEKMANASSTALVPLQYIKQKGEQERDNRERMEG